MERLELLRVSRTNQQAIFDQDAQVPDDAHARADLGVAKLVGVDDTFESAVNAAFGKASIAEVYQRLATDGLDSMVRAIAGNSELGEEAVRSNLTHIDEIFGGAAYFRLLPRGIDKQIFLTDGGHLVSDPSKAPPTELVNRANNLHMLGILLAESETNPLESLVGATREGLLRHVQTLIDAVKNGSGGTDPVSEKRVSEPGLRIPDRDANGVSDVIAIEGQGLVDDIEVNLDITHTYIGDLNVTLVAPDGTEVALHARSGGGADDIKKRFTVADLSAMRGVEMNGQWKLKVSDHAGQDVGVINSWSVKVATVGGEGHVSRPELVIPDNNREGISDKITVADAGQIRDLTVDLSIVHTYRGDLIVDLTAPDGTVVTLHNKEGGSSNNISRSYTMNNEAIRALLGKEMQGDWTLRVRDTAGQDVGTLKSWRLDFGTDSAGGPQLTETQRKAYFAGAGAILRRLARVGTDAEKNAAFDTVAQLIKDCPDKNVRTLLVAGLYQSRADLTSASRAKFDAEIMPLVAPKSPMYDEIFQISYQDGRPVAAKRSLNVAVYYGNEEDDLIYQGGIKMIQGKGFVEADSSDKPGFRLFIKKVNQDDADAPCQEIRMYVAHMNGTNMLSAMNDPDIDVIQYDGHSNLGRNIENSLDRSPELAGNKVLVLGACATTDRLFSLRHKYPDTHKVQFVNTYESTYFSWTKIDDKKVMNYSENMMAMFGLVDSMSDMKDWQAMNRDLKRATDAWSHSVDVNYTNPGKLEWLMMTDFDRDGIPDGIDSVWDGGRVIPDSAIRDQFNARAPAGQVRRLDATKVFKATQSLDTMGRYNKVLERAYRVRTIQSKGFKDLGENGPMVKIEAGPNRAWSLTVNSWYSHASSEAIRTAAHYEFIKAAMAEGHGRTLNATDQNAMALLFAASSLRFDNSSYDTRVWTEFLEAYNFPRDIRIYDLFDVIDEEHERRPHDLTGGYRNIAEVKEALGDAITERLGRDDVGVWTGGN